MSDEPKRADERHDDIARLVRLAGKREAVPQEAAERVREATHAAWRAEVRRRSRRKTFGGFAALTAAAALLLAVGLRIGMRAPTSGDSAIRVEAVQGALWVREATEPALLREIPVDAVVPNGAELSTGENDLAAIRLASGHSIRLGRSTTLRLLDAATVALDLGTIYVDSFSGEDRHHDLVVETAFGAVQEIGTQFEVRLDDRSLLVRLREGAVVLHRDGRTHRVTAGSELELGAGDSPVTRPIAIHGPEWDWLLGVTPMLDLNGRTAREFLDWVARERGWRVAYSDGAVARHAERTVLEGSLQNLGFEEALDTALLSCMMGYRVDDGVLLVRSLDQP
jgi:ferric-dicitrate binding protein FerR (iron transport regulator)